MELMQGFLDWINAYPQWAGVAIFLVAASESLIVVGILVPGVLFMIGVGALIGMGVLDFWTCFLWAAAGAIAGDGFSYWLGMHYHKQLQSVWPLSRYPALVPRGERFFRKHGGKSVFFGRFIGPIRAIIPAVAGIMEMPALQFYVVNVLSALLWAPVVLLPGIALGTSIDAAAGASTRIVVLFVLIAVVLWLVYLAVKRAVMTLVRKSALQERHVYTVLLLLSGIAAISSGGYISYKKNGLDEFLGIDDQLLASWQESGWARVPAVVPGNLIRKPRPVSIQWFAGKNTIENVMSSSGWERPVPLTYANTFLWLVPGVEVYKQPVLPEYYLWNLPAITYIYRQNDNNELIVMRLWTGSKEKGVAGNKLSGEEVSGNKLWVGYVSIARPGSRLGLLFMPQQMEDHGLALQELEKIIDHHKAQWPVPVRKMDASQYVKVLLFDSRNAARTD